MTIVDGRCVRDIVTRIHRDARRSPSSGQGHDMPYCHVHGGHEGHHNHDLRHALQVDVYPIRDSAVLNETIQYQHANLAASRHHHTSPQSCSDNGKTRFKRSELRRLNMRRLDCSSTTLACEKNWCVPRMCTRTEHYVCSRASTCAQRGE